MTLRAGVYTYLVLLHVAFAGAVIGASDGGWWIVGVEVAALVSLVVGLALARRLLGAFEVADSGERLIREGDFTTRLRPTGDARIDGLIAVYNQMVDHLRLERSRVQEQEHLLDRMMTASPSGMLMLDFDGRVSAANPAATRLLGEGGGLLVGTDLGALPPPFGETLSGLRVGATEVIHLSGGRRLRCRRGAFVDRGFQRSFFVFEELTEEMRQAERRAYEKLIRVMSHEVNNSVTAAGSLVESSLLYARDLPAAPRAELESALRIALDRLSALNRFLRRFADVYRLPAPTLQRCDLRALLASAAALARAWPGAPTIDLTWAPDAPTVSVVVDREQFEQVVLNVLKNAVEAAGSAGAVRVGVAADGGAVLVTIDDSGVGPDAEASAHLFTPFFSTKAEGQGIGLTLVQEILGAHGFSGALERLPEGMTRFTIRMPQSTGMVERTTGAGEGTAPVGGAG